MLPQTGENAGITEDNVQQIRNVWAGLDNRKRIVVAVAVIATFLAVLSLSRMAASPTMKLLYAGLEAGTAGDVVRALEQRGTHYEVRGGSIYVPASERDELRMTLASEGLPSNGSRGYELLDSLSGFGTTSQMFDAAYWRAKEGELARTIVASPYVGQARVHIANTGSNPFQRSFEPTASVSVIPSGAPISAAQADAVRHLVASAVAGLSPENVAVIDANGRLIGSPETATVASAAEDRASKLRERVLRLVEARVGPGNAVVEVSVDTVTETESIRERRFDPESRVAISTDIEERSDSSTNTAGEVTVASNLPDGDAAGGDGSNARASATRERINYEVSETELEIHRAPGAVKRLTVAVLVNGVPNTDAQGNPVMADRSPEELEALRELVASAVGFDADRGDVITLKSMALPAVEPAGTAGALPLADRLGLDMMALVQVVALVLVTAILALFVLRPVLAAPAALPAPAARREAEQDDAPAALSGEIENAETGQFEPLPGAKGAAAPGIAAGAPEMPGAGAGGADWPAAGGLPQIATPPADPVERLRAMIGDRQEETIEILRGWLEEDEERA